jgi:gamma-glutamylcyclotransferase
MNPNNNDIDKVNTSSVNADYLLYFAYGSNMDNERLFSRIGSADKFDNGTISGKKLLFNKLGQDGTGKANLINHDDGVAFGILFRVNESDLIKLDKFEVGYKRKTLKIKSDNHGHITAISYLADSYTDFISPSKEYMNHIINGADDMSLEYINYLKSISTLD